MKLFLKPNQRGHIHLLAPIIAIAAVMCIGGLVALRISHAATPGCYGTTVPGSSSNCTRDAQQMINGILGYNYFKADSTATINRWTVSKLNSPTTFDVDNGFSKLYSSFGGTDEGWLKQIQGQHGLPETGTVNAATWQALCTATNTVSNSGASNTVASTDYTNGKNANNGKKIMWYVRSYMRTGITAADDADCTYILSKKPTPVTPPPAPTAPTITITKTTIGTTTATITWTTNQSTTSWLRYNYTTPLTAATLTSAAGTVHTVTIGNLKADTHYPYEISATNSAKKTTLSIGHSFTTTAVTVGGGGTPTCSSTAPTITSFTKLVFCDNFSGAKLNTSNWNTFMTSRAANGYPWQAGSVPAGDSGNGGPNSDSAAYYAPTELSVNNGLNILAAPSSIIPGFSYVGGVVTSYNHFQFDGGYVQFTVKMPADLSDGGWPALWFLPGPGGTGGDRGEIDLFEGGFVNTDMGLASSVPQDQVFASHYNGPTTGWVAQGYNTGVDMSAGYHTYGMEYKPGVSIKTFFDGHLVADWTKDINTDPYEIIVANELASQATAGWHTTGNPLASSTTMSTAGVQVYE
jgi:hypothetical protein